MPCKLCLERGQDWKGDSPKCAFDGPFDENWNCATINALRCISERHIAISGMDQHTSLFKVSSELCDDGYPLALFITWYKCRGNTDQVWIMFADRLPRRPSESECIEILETYK